MRHRIHGKQLCRDSEHRTAMLRNLAAGLFEHGGSSSEMDGNVYYDSRHLTTARQLIERALVKVVVQP